MIQFSTARSDELHLRELIRQFNSNSGAGPITNDAVPRSVVAHLPRLDVNHELLQVRYNGKVHDITASQAHLLQALVDARGDWVSASGLGITKPSRIKDTLPEPIKALIETLSGHGYRLKRIERR